MVKVIVVTGLVGVVCATYMFTIIAVWLKGWEKRINKTIEDSLNTYSEVMEEFMDKYTVVVNVREKDEEA